MLPAAPENDTRRPNLKRHVFLLVLGLALFGLLAYFGGIEGLRQLGRLRLVPLAGVLATTLGITALTALRWGMLVEAMAGRRVASWLAYYRYFVVSRALGFVLPKDLTDLGGRTLWVYKGHDVALTQAGGSVLLDRLFDVLVSALFLLAVLPYWLGLIGATVSLLLMLGLAGLMGVLFMVTDERFVAWSFAVANKGIALLYRLPGLRRRTPQRLAVQGLSPTLMLRAYGYSVVKFGFAVGRFICIALAVGLPIPPVLFLMGMPLGQFSYLVAFTPGGLGIFEAGWFAILSVGSVPTEAVSLFLVAQRVLILVAILIFALISQGIYMLRVK